MTIRDELAANLGRDPRILTLDLERLPGEVTLDCWEPRDFQRISYVHPDRWSVVPRTLCASYKWLHEKQVRFVAAWENPDDPYHVARTLWEAVDLADWIVTFNGRRADMKWLRTDWVEAGMMPPAPWKDVDLFLVARREFSFESKSLRYLCERLGMPLNKEGHYDSNIAKSAMLGDRKHQLALKRYNVQDTKVTEAVFDRLRPHVKGVNWGLYRGDKSRVCRNCGDVVLDRVGVHTGITGLYVIWRCRECKTLTRDARRSAGVPMREP